MSTILKPPNEISTVVKILNNLSRSDCVDLARSQQWSIASLWPFVFPIKEINKCRMIKEYTANSNSKQLLKKYLSINQSITLPRKVIIEDTEKNTYSQLKDGILCPPRREFDVTVNVDCYVVSLPQRRGAVVAGCPGGDSSDDPSSSSDSSTTTNNNYIFNYNANHNPLHSDSSDEDGDGGPGGPTTASGASLLGPSVGATLPGVITRAPQSGTPASGAASAGAGTSGTSSTTGSGGSSAGGPPAASGGGGASGAGGGGGGGDSSDSDSSSHSSPPPATPPVYPNVRHLLPSNFDPGVDGHGKYFYPYSFFLYHY